MNTVKIDPFSIKYDQVQTEQCPIKLANQTYIEGKPLPRYFIGKSTMSFYDFYQADCPDLKEIDYQLSEKFQQIIKKFPHTNQQKIYLNDEGSYSIKKVPLLWPDYLYHKPDNHVEFGLLANTEQARYQLFDQWENNEQVMIEILADGFEDVQFVTHLKQPMHVPPKLSKSEYVQGELICLSLDSGLIKELEQQVAGFELVKSKKTSDNGYSLIFQLTENQLVIPSRQFEKMGRYQLKITSNIYGQLLFLFTIKQEG